MFCKIPDNFHSIFRQCRLTTLKIRKNKDEIKNLKGELRDIKHEIKDIKEFNGKVTKQLKLMTTKDEVTKLEKYIDLWNPMDFVTRDELKEAHEKTIEELRSIIETFLTDDK